MSVLDDLVATLKAHFGRAIEIRYGHVAGAGGNAQVPFVHCRLPRHEPKSVALHASPLPPRATHIIVVGLQNA